MDMLVGARENRVKELLLQGCDNHEMSRYMGIAERTVKAYLSRMFIRFGIKNGIKRVKLAILMYEKQPDVERQEVLPTLTKREKAVIQRVAKGYTNGEIASMIGVTEHVVKNMLRSIYEKLGMWNRVELALWYETRNHERF